MSLQCPNCFSVLIIQKRYAQKAGSILRALSGFGHVLSTTINTGKAGATVGMVACPSAPLRGLSSAA